MLSVAAYPSRQTTLSGSLSNTNTLNHIIHHSFGAVRRGRDPKTADVVTGSRADFKAAPSFLSSHPESPRVEFAAHACLFRVYRQSPVNRGKELTCKAISSSSARTTA